MRQPPPELPNRIREIRERKGLSQTALGALVGCRNQQISKLETGALRLSTLWMRRLAQALDVEPWELLSRRDAGALDDELELFARYRELDDERRAAVLRLVNWLRGDDDKKSQD